MKPEQKAEIDAMSHLELARKWRHAPPGDPLFRGPAGIYFKQVLDAKGGITPAISKAIGWK